MGWREQMGTVEIGDGQALVAGSFRGMPFRTVDAATKGGRRNVVNEFPQRDTPFTEDLGRKARRFVVECYLVGANYLNERDQLIAAFEQAGSGELRHPRYGIRMVAIDGDFEVKESPSMGGMAKITVTFVEDGVNRFPTATQNTVAKLEAAANAADDAAQAAFAQKFEVRSPGALQIDALKSLNKSAADLLATARRVTSLGALPAIVRDVAALTGTLTDLIRTPVALVQGLRSLWAQTVQEVARPLAALAELQAVFGAAPAPVVLGVVLAGSSRAKSLANAGELAALDRRLAISNQARLVALALGAALPVSGGDTSGTSTGVTAAPLVATRGQALAMRDAVAKQIDTELEANDPPAEVAAALRGLRAALVRDVAQRGELLLAAGSYTPAAVLPAVVLAHRIYNDATRWQELAQRNGVAHAGFVPTKTLETLL